MNVNNSFSRWILCVKRDYELPLISSTENPMVILIFLNSFKSIEVSSSSKTPMEYLIEQSASTSDIRHDLNWKM